MAESGVGQLIRLKRNDNFPDICVTLKILSSE
jgi:hypothetical protein